MRGIGYHTPPPATQPEPGDIVTRYVYAQIRVWEQTGLLIHTEVAREIAAWWQSPGTDDTPFTAFAGAGTVGPYLTWAIQREIAALVGAPVVEAWGARVLRALGAYVEAAQIEAG